MGFLTGRGYMPSATAVLIQPRLTAGQRRSHQGNTSANRAARRVLELELEAGHGQGERTQGTQPMAWHVGGCWETPWKLPSPRHTPLQNYLYGEGCASLKRSDLLDSQGGVGRRGSGWNSHGLDRKSGAQASVTDLL